MPWYLRLVRAAAAPVAAIAAVLSGLGIATTIDVERDVHVDRPQPIDAPGGLVALGDSYSSGEGLAPYLDPTADIGAGGNRCHRSDRAYGHLLGAQPGASFSFVACASATVQNVFDVEQEHRSGAIVQQIPLQAAQAPGSADIVTLTMSGNDVLFSKVVIACALPDCVNRRWLDAGQATKVSISEWAPGALAAVEKKVEALYTGLRARFAAPARIVVLGYPRLFSDTPSRVGQGQCGIYSALWSGGERAFLRELGDQFNAILARQAVEAGLEYVDTSEAFDGHETCGRKGQWLAFAGEGSDQVYGSIRDSLRNLEADPSNFHPTAKGQRMLGRMVACYLQVNPVDPYSPEARAAAAAATTRAEAVGSTHAGLRVPAADPDDEPVPDDVLACALGEEG